MSKETKQIAELNAEMWVIVNPKGVIFPRSLEFTPHECKDEYEDNWEAFEKLGYRCIPVSVNIKPIEQ